MVRPLCACLTSISVLATPALAEPSYRLNKAQTRVVALSGLFDGGDLCRSFTTSGRITEQNFSGPRVIGFTLAEKDGSRSYYNVDPITLDNAGNRVTVGWISDGLQKMLEKGKRVSVRALACGAAGSVLYLDAVRPQ